MNYTQEQLTALSDIELNLIIARDVAGLEDVRIETEFHDCNDKRVCYGPLYKTCPDYLNDLNAIDDLCKEKGFNAFREADNFSASLKPIRIVLRFGQGQCVVVEEREGEFPRCRFLCEALVLAWQESKK